MVENGRFVATGLRAVFQTPPMGNGGGLVKLTGKEVNSEVDNRATAFREGGMEQRRSIGFLWSGHFRR
jgi:hypothetical protein